MVIMALIEELISYAQKTIGGDIILAVAIVVMGFIASAIVRYILQEKVKKLIEKTETDLDDVVFEVMEKPLERGVLLVAAYLALSSLAGLSAYSALITSAFFVIAVLWATNVVQRLVSAFIPRWIHVINKKHEKSPQLIARIINVILYIIAALIILDHFQIQITPIIAALGIGGLAVGLALQDSLSNFFAGMYIVTGSSLRIGDFIEIPSEKISGNIEDIGWRATRIRTTQNSTVIVPNSKISQSVVINTHLPDKEVGVNLECGVSYGSTDLEKVERTTVEVAEKIQQNVPGAVKDFKPIVRFHTFGESNINFTVTMRAEEQTFRAQLVHEFIKALKARFDAEKIEISYPVRNVYQLSAITQKIPQINKK